MSFKQRFTKLIETLNLKQVELAEKLGVHKSTISKLVNGNIEPNLELLQNLRLKFGININWLVAGTGKMKEDYSLEESKPLQVSEPKPNLLQDKYINSLEELIVNYKAEIKRLKDKCGEAEAMPEKQTNRLK